MQQDSIPRAAFVAWGRVGGKVKSKKRAAASRRNWKKALKVLRGRKVKKKQLTLGLGV